MKKKDSTFWNMLWSLTLITAVAGGLLGYTIRHYPRTLARAAKAGREKAIQQVIPKYDNSPIDEQCPYTVRNEYGETTAIVYPAKKEGILVGAAVECSNSTGYGGEIRIIVGFEADGTIRDYRVHETSGNARIGRQKWTNGSELRKITRISSGNRRFATNYKSNKIPAT